MVKPRPPQAYEYPQSPISGFAEAYVGRDGTTPRGTDTTQFGDVQQAGEAQIIENGDYPSSVEDYVDRLRDELTDSPEYQRAPHGERLVMLRRFNSNMGVIRYHWGTGSEFDKSGMAPNEKPKQHENPQVVTNGEAVVRLANNQATGDVVSGKLAQGTLDFGFFPDPVEAKRRPGRKYAIVGFLSTSFHRKILAVKSPRRAESNTYTFGLLLDKEREWMRPEKIGSILMPARQSSARLPEGAYIDGVLVTANEYEIIPRSIPSFKEAARQHTLNSRKPSDGDWSEEDLAAADRGSLHRIEEKLPKLTEYMEENTERREKVQKLLEHLEIDTFRSAVLTKSEINSLFSSAWEELLEILSVLHANRKWTPEQRQFAETAMLAVLTTGSAEKKRTSWMKMMGFTCKYLEEKQKIAQNKVMQINKILEPAVETA